MYLTRKAELAEVAALVSPLELPPTMRGAAAADAAGGGSDRHTSFASAAGSAAPPIFHMIAGPFTAQSSRVQSLVPESCRRAVTDSRPHRWDRAKDCLVRSQKQDASSLVRSISRLVRSRLLTWTRQLRRTQHQPCPRTIRQIWRAWLIQQVNFCGCSTAAG